MRSDRLAAKPKWAGAVRKGQQLRIVHGDHSLEKGAIVYFKSLTQWGGDWFADISRTPLGVSCSQRMTGMRRRPDINTPPGTVLLCVESWSPTVIAGRRYKLVRMEERNSQGACWAVIATEKGWSGGHADYRFVIDEGDWDEK